MNRRPIVYDIASAASQLVRTAAPSRKSSISMASRGLWLPLALRTNNIADGTPATVKVAVSCEAGLASGMVAMPSALAAAVNFATTSGCEGATSADVRDPELDVHATLLADLSCEFVHGIL